MLQEAEMNLDMKDFGRNIIDHDIIESVSKAFGGMTLALWS